MKREKPSDAKPVIDAREFAGAGEVLEGVLPVAGFERLAGLLSGKNGEVRYRLRGTRDALNRPALGLEFETAVEVTCQRCLQPFTLPLAGANRLRLVDREPEWTGEEIEAAEEDDEIVASAALDVAELVEDEVLLALPLAPRHARCEVAGGKADLGRESPFKVLEKLKHR